MENKTVNRFEIIDSNGRAMVVRGEISFSEQDDGKTLKVFITGNIKDYITTDERV